MPKRKSGPDVDAEKARARALIEEAERAKAEQERLAMYDFITSAPAARLKFDLSAMQMGPTGIPVVPGRKRDAVYMPLMPKH